MKIIKIINDTEIIDDKKLLMIQKKKLLPYVKDWGMNIFVSLIYFKLKYNIQSTCILLQFSIFTVFDNSSTPFQQQHIKGILDSQVEGG